METKKEYKFEELSEDVQDRLIGEMIEDTRNDLLDSIIHEQINDKLYDIKVNLDVDSEFVRDVYEGTIEIEDYVNKNLGNITEDTMNSIIEIIEDSLYEANDISLNSYAVDILYEDNCRYDIEGNVL